MFTDDSFYTFVAAKTPDIILKNRNVPKRKMFKRIKRSDEHGTMLFFQAIITTNYF